MAIPNSITPDKVKSPLPEVIAPPIWWNVVTHKLRHIAGICYLFRMLEHLDEVDLQEFSLGHVGDLAESLALDCLDTLTGLEIETNESPVNRILDIYESLSASEANEVEREVRTILDCKKPTWFKGVVA